jgi:hypothetical protein
MDREMPEREDARTPGHHPVGLAPLEARIVAAVPDQASFDESSPPATLRIRPMHLSQAIEVWTHELPSPAWTVVVGASTDESSAADRDAIEAMTGRSRERLGVSPSAATSGAMQEPLLLDDEEFELLAGAASWRSLTAIRIEGPVDAGDVEAILAAIRAGRPAISGDLRAVATLRVEAGGGLEFAARSMRPIARLVAEDLACYAAAVLRRSADEVSRPPLHQVLRLLESSGSISVRPEETDVFAESIDVGVSTSAAGDRPADRSLIYDLPSDSWHDE